MSRKINLSYKLPIDWRIVLIIGISLIIAIIFNVWAGLISLFLQLVLFRLFSGKFKVVPGDVVYIFGLPGAGKTMFMAKLADDNQKLNFIFCNPELSHLTIKDGVFCRDDIGHFSFPEPSLLLFDEASLDGFDNRNFKSNFDADNLYFLKKIRHYNASIVFTNHSPDELDKKIRDGLVSHCYYVENKGFYSRATRIDKTMLISLIDNDIKMANCFPTFIDRIIDPSCVIYYSHRRYGKLYRTQNAKRLPLINFNADADASDKTSNQTAV